jgi:hypothetical protein
MVFIEARCHILQLYVDTLKAPGNRMQHEPDKRCEEA